MRPAHTFARDLLGLLKHATSPEVDGETATTDYQYNADRMITKLTRPNGKSADFTYDQTGRLTGIDADEGEQELTYGPISGNLKSSTSASGITKTFSYDGSLLEGVSDQNVITPDITIGHDAALRVNALTLGSNSTSYAYDQDSLITGAGDLTLSRRASDGLVTQSALGAITTSTAFNQYAEPTSESATLPGGAPFQMTFARDAFGRITSRTEQTPTTTSNWTYAYDAQGRLQSAEKDGVPYSAYAYDANGNRTSETIEGESTTATFDARDRMRTSGENTYAYNQNGELTTRTNSSTGKSASFTYDTFGNLTGAQTEDGKSITYKLDAQANRTTRLVDGQISSRFVYAPGIQGPIAQLEGDGSVKARYVYATRSNVPDYIEQGDKDYRVLTDQLGSVRLVVDADTGVVAQEIGYDPFGRVIDDTNPGFQPFGFAGGLYDSDTRLTHFGAREYSADMGRWTASDPISFAGGDANLYGYVVGDPVNFVDPSGLYFGSSLVDRYSNFVNQNAHLSYLSNYAAGALNGMLGNVPNSILGLSGQCAGSGYGLGSFLGSVGGTAVGVSKFLEAARALRAAEFALRASKTFAPLRTGELADEVLRARNLLGSRMAGEVAKEYGGNVLGEVNNQLFDTCGC